jgi:ketopantoate reductase
MPRDPLETFAANIFDALANLRAELAALTGRMDVDIDMKARMHQDFERMLTEAETEAGRLIEEARGGSVDQLKN